MYNIASQCTKNETTYNIIIDNNVVSYHEITGNQFDKYRHRIYEQYNNKDIYYYV